jgi:chitin disaccharide deacetylase
MRIVLNADDFGASEETVRATIECFESGALTSATIMPGMPATETALEYARSRPDLSFGVHLLLTGDGAERPVARDVPRLTGPDGSFPSGRDARIRALTRRLPADQLERELAAQVELVRSAGVEVSHVDSHRHLHKLPPVRRALERVLRQQGVTRVRNVQNVFLRPQLTSPTYWLGRLWAGPLQRAFTTTDRFYMPTGLADVGWEETLLDSLRGFAGSLEVGVHPGFEEDWRSDERRAGLRFAERARAEGHELVPWTAIA